MNRLITVFAAVTAGLAALFALDVLPFLRGGFGWQWPYLPVDPVRLLPLLIALMIYGLGAARLYRHPRGLTIWSAVGVIALTIAALLARHDDPLHELALRTLSPLTTGSHTAAAVIDWSGTGWHDWPTQMAAFEGRIAHVNLAPPALPLLYAAAADLLDRVPALARLLGAPLLAEQCHNYAFLTYTPGEWAAGWLGVLMPVWAALTAFPVVSAARRMGGPAAGTIAAVVYPLIPALLIFTPTWNTLYPLLSVTAFLLLEAGLNAARPPQRVIRLVSAGLITGLAVFVNFAFVPLGLLFGLYTLLRWLWSERGHGVAFTAPVLAGAIFGLGVIAPWLVYGALTGSWPWELLAASMGMHLELDRAYLPWLWLHTWDWALWTGLPLIVLVGAALIWRPAGARPPVLAAALIGTIMILVLSNFARGETGRVWTLFAPFVVAAAAAWLAQSSSSGRGLWRMAAAQAAWVIALTAVIDAVEVDLRLPPAPPIAHAETAPVSADFNGEFQLVGWSAAAQADAIVLNLNWQAAAPIFQPYAFSALLVDPAGAPVGAAVVWQPDATRYPATCWPPGAVIGDSVRLPLPAVTTPGDYWISVAAFSDAEGVNRLPVTVPGAASDQVGLGPVRLPAGS